MITVFKALTKSLFDKKLRLFLVIFSIAASAALIYANECFSQICTQKFYEADVRWGGNSDIYIEGKETVGAKEWIDLKELSGYKDKFKYEFHFVEGKALYAPSIEEMHYFSIIGVDIEKFNTHNPVSLSDGSFQNWDGFKIILGETYAKKYNLKVNDVMKLELNGSQYDFKVAGISEAKGLFLRELADGGFILAPKNTISDIFKGDTNLVFIKLKDSTQKEAVKEALTEELDEYKVEYAIDDALIEAETLNYVLPFIISAIAVIFMSIFIIFTAFNLITIERIPMIGTLRSIGLSRKKINRMLVGESAFLGVLGGFIGCLLGIVVLEFIQINYFRGEKPVLNANILLGAKQIIMAIGASVIIAVFSAIIPILRITRTPIKNIILNDIHKKQGKKNRLWIIGFILMSLAAIVPYFLESSLSGMIAGCVLATGALVGLVPLIPFLTYHLSRFIGKIPFLRYDIILGIRNIRDNKNLLNNIQLFSVSIAIVAFMASIFNTMGSDLIKAYKEDMKYDIRVILRHTDDQTVKLMSDIEGVEACNGDYFTDAGIANYQTFINILYGINDESFFEYETAGQLDKNRDAIKNLNSGKNIITTNVLKSKLGLQTGDNLVIKFGSKEVTYKITGFVDTNAGIGHVGYISSENFRKDLEISDYSEILVKAKGDPDTVKSNIKRALNKDVIRIETKEEMAEANSDKVMGVFNAISCYSYIALIIGIIGIVNNLIVSLIQRKRSFAMYRCIGMSKKSLNKMLITEAVVVGVYGICFGLTCAIILSTVIPLIVSIFWGAVTTQLAIKEMAIMGLAGITAMFAIALVPVIKSNKFSILESIKYE